MLTQKEYSAFKEKYPVRLYKKGAQLLCLADYLGVFTKGKIYISNGMDYNYDINVVRLVDDKGEHNGWGIRFFMPVLSKAGKALFQVGDDK